MFKDTYNITNDALKFDLIKNDDNKTVIISETSYLDNIKRLLKNEFYRSFQRPKRSSENRKT